MKVMNELFRKIKIASSVIFGLLAIITLLGLVFSQPQLIFVPPTPDEGYKTLEISPEKVALNWNGMNITLNGGDLLFNCHFDGMLECEDGEVPSNYGNIQFTDAIFDNGLDFSQAIPPETYVEYFASNNIAPEKGTVMFWFKTNDQWSDGSKTYFLFYTGSIALYQSFNQLKFQIISADSEKQRVYTLDKTLFDGNWHHVALVWDSENPVRADKHLALYIDGQDKSENYINANDPFVVGQQWFIYLGSDPGGNNPCNATYDELRIYNRPLSQEEIAKLKDTSVGKFYANMTKIPPGSYSYYGLTNDGFTIYSTETRTITFSRIILTVLTKNNTIFSNLDGTVKIDYIVSAPDIEKCLLSWNGTIIENTTRVVTDGATINSFVLNSSNYDVKNGMYLWNITCYSGQNSATSNTFIAEISIPEPNIEAVWITPDNPTEIDDLTCHASAWNYTHLSYLWYKNGQLILGETSSTLSRELFSAGDKITCVVNASNAVGFVIANSSVRKNIIDFAKFLEGTTNNTTFEKENPLLRFVHVSDAHVETEGYLTINFTPEIFNATMQALKNEPIDYIISTGDNTEDSDEEEFIFIANVLNETNLANKFLAVGGNHDAWGMYDFVKYVPPHEANWTLTVGNILFIGIDSNDCGYEDPGEPLRQDQLEFLNRTLYENRNKSKIVVMLMHHPIYGYRKVANADDVLAIIRNYTQDYKAMLFFHGHVHEVEINDTFAAENLYMIRSGSLGKSSMNYRYVEIYPDEIRMWLGLPKNEQLINKRNEIAGSTAEGNFYDKDYFYVIKLSQNGNLADYSVKLARKNYIGNPRFVFEAEHYLPYWSMDQNCWPQGSEYGLLVNCTNNKRVVEQKLRLEPNKNYTLSFYAKATQLDGDIACKVYTEGFKTNAEIYIDGVTSDFVKYTAHIETNESFYGLLRIVTSGTGVAKCYFDKLQLEQGLSASEFSEKYYVNGTYITPVIDLKGVPASRIEFDGTSASYFSQSGESLSNLAGMRYLQVKAYMRSNGSITPVLSKLVVVQENYEYKIKPISEIKLKKGWNLIGFPIQTTKHYNSLLVSNGTHMLNITETDLIDPIFYYFDDGYKTVCHENCDTSEVYPWHGYWVRALTDNISIIVNSGTLAEGNKLPAGWNLVSFPINNTKDYNEIFVTNGVEMKSLFEAGQSGWIQSTFFYFNNTYQTVCMNDECSTTKFEPGKGYWVLSFEPGLKFVLPG